MCLAVCRPAIEQTAGTAAQFGLRRTNILAPNPKSRHRRCEKASARELLVFDLLQHETRLFVGRSALLLYQPPSRRHRCRAKQTGAADGGRSSAGRNVRVSLNAGLKRRSRNVREVPQADIPVPFIHSGRCGATSPPALCESSRLVRDRSACQKT